MYKAEILADSKNPQGCRLTTMKITFPRIVLAEFNTHRMFSRNSASSRAIPFKKMVEMVEENPFIPIACQKDHKGMQGTEYFNKEESESKIVEWEYARHSAIDHAKELHQKGVTKQLCNRLLEPFMWHTVIVTSSEEGLKNFFNLRCPQYTSEGYYEGTFKSKKEMKRAWGKKVDYPDDDNLFEWLKINKSQADIHIQAIAELMWDVYNESTPKQLQAGEWHIPFGDMFEWDELLKTGVPTEDYNLLLKIAVARCARISYQTLGDNPKTDYAADVRLHDMLMESKHWSPFEHIAMALSNDGMVRNFKGFTQYRAMVENG